MLLPVLHFVATVPDRCTSTFFGLKPWFYYFPESAFDGECRITDFTTLDPNAPSSFLLIAFALIDDLLRVAAFVAVGFIIYGGFQYIMSQGSPDAAKKAQQTILNALIGLVIAILAASITAFIGTKLGS